MLRVGVLGTGGGSSTGDLRLAGLDGEFKLFVLVFFLKGGTGLAGGRTREVMVLVVLVRGVGVVLPTVARAVIRAEDFVGDDGVERVGGLGIRDMRVSWMWYEAKMRAQEQPNIEFSHFPNPDISHFGQIHLTQIVSVSFRGAINVYIVS